MPVKTLAGKETLYHGNKNCDPRIAEESGGDVSIPGITTSAARIDELMALLVDNRVGPAGLSDVVADWL